MVRFVRDRVGLLVAVPLLAALLAACGGEADDDGEDGGGQDNGDQQDGNDQEDEEGGYGALGRGARVAVDLDAARAVVIR